MEFEGQYLTYEDYKELGGEISDLMPFNLLEFEARRKIDISTRNRLKDIDYEDIPQEVKLCEYNMINSIQKFTETETTISNSSNISSESTDGYSVTYITPDKISEVIRSKENELDDIIRTYLLGVVVNEEHIMYAGIKQ